MKLVDIRAGAARARNVVAGLADRVSQVQVTAGAFSATLWTRRAVVIDPAEPPPAPCEPPAPCRNPGRCLAHAVATKP